MRWPNLLLGSLVLAFSFQPLLAAPLQTAERPANHADSVKSNRFDLARASGFDFGRMSELTHRENNRVILNPMRLNDLVNLSNQDLCYSLRVYSFTREGTEAPQMTGSTACTPANRAVLKGAEGPKGPSLK